MERTAADDVALTDLPSTSGAHWANRDNDATYREPGGRLAPFRRPPALNSFPDDDEALSPSAYLPDDSGDVPATSWFAGRDTDPRGTWPHGLGPQNAQPPAPEPKAPEYGPAPPSSPGRISFGFSAGPISPSHALPADAPTSPATGYPTRPTREGRRREAPAEDTGIGQITGPGHEIRPHRASRRDVRDARDHNRDTGAHEQIQVAGAHSLNPPHGGPQDAPPKRSRMLVVATVALSAVVLLGGAVAGVSYFSGDDQSLSSVLQLGAGGSTKGKIATAPLDGRKTAAFELLAATTKVNLSTADLGKDLFKITAADDSGMVPKPVVSKTLVQLQLTPGGDGSTGEVSVVLSTKVRWSLRFTGGADEQIVDLSGGQIAGIDVIGGSRRFELSLPKAKGTVPVHVTGAIEDFSIQSPPTSPIRVQVRGGAKTVAAGAVTLRDVKPGSTLTPKDWKVANRYDVDAAARLTLLTVDSAG